MKVHLIKIPNPNYVWGKGTDVQCGLRVPPYNATPVSRFATCKNCIRANKAMMRRCHE